MNKNDKIINRGATVRPITILWAVKRSFARTYNDVSGKPEALIN